jgi:hypothetical protein
MMASYNWWNPLSAPAETLTSIISGPQFLRHRTLTAFMEISQSGQQATNGGGLTFRGA